MSATKGLRLLLGLAVVASWATGCVSRDEHLRVDFARRKALERSETLQRDLDDERNKTLAMETEREYLKREAQTKSAENDTLKAESARLAAYVEKLQGQMDDVLASPMGGIEIVEVKLPAELDRALKEFSSRYPDAVEYDPKRGAVRWKSDLTFGKGSDEVRPGAAASLAEFAEIVRSQAASQFEVVVVGHTDALRISSAVTKRNHPTNWHLSVHRAIAVMEALHRGGIDYRRMGCMGYGEFHPSEPNPPRGGNEANRRVEVFLVGGRDAIGTMNAG